MSDAGCRGWRGQDIHYGRNRDRRTGRTPQSKDLRGKPSNHEAPAVSRRKTLYGKNTPKAMAREQRFVLILCELGALGGETPFLSADGRAFSTRYAPSSST